MSQHGPGMAILQLIAVLLAIILLSPIIYGFFRARREGKPGHDDPIFKEYFPWLLQFLLYLLLGFSITAFVLMYLERLPTTWAVPAGQAFLFGLGILVLTLLKGKE